MLAFVNKIMADEGIFATTAEILRHAGVGASSTSKDEAYTNQYIAEAESWINILTGVNYSDSYSTLDADKRDILKLASAVYAAIGVCKFDVSGYSRRTGKYYKH
jgi:hypothetical protein